MKNQTDRQLKIEGDSLVAHGALFTIFVKLLNKGYMDFPDRLARRGEALLDNGTYPELDKKRREGSLWVESEEEKAAYALTLDFMENYCKTGELNFNVLPYYMRNTEWRSDNE